MTILDDFAIHDDLRVEGLILAIASDLHLQIAISKKSIIKPCFSFVLAGNNARGFKFSDTACFDIQLTGEQFYAQTPSFCL